MNVDKLVELLEDKGFQDPKTGNLFFGAYIYCYPPQEEYEMQQHLVKLTQRLKRPNHFLDCLTIDLYQLFINYMKSNYFGEESYFEDAVLQEEETPEKALEYILYEIENQQFYDYVEEKIKTYFKAQSDKRVYLLVHGVGQIYPYLRASTFLKRIEALVKDFKIILFYPGSYIDGEYSLFNQLRTDNIYRVTRLNTLIGD